jgi:transposase InsO family protein
MLSKHWNASAKILAIQKQSVLIRDLSLSRGILICGLTTKASFLNWTLRARLRLSRPGKPTDNSFIESFNGKFRAECLNTHWFMNLDDARIKMEAWSRDYNETRPHSAIGNKPPISLQKGSSAAEPT